MVYAIVTVLVLIADQAVKFWTTKNILLDAIGDECVTLIPGVIHMTNVHNYGAAFSILENARWLLIAVSVIFVIAIIVLISQEIIHTPFGKWTAVLVMAGALGNCLDRILYGYVVDMFELEFMSFAVFNVADIFITVCGILFCIHVIIYREPEAVRVANESPAARRRREEREAKQAPYDQIPRRGEHRSLDEDLRLADPEDPFSEWGFGDVVDEPAPEEEPEAPRRRASRTAEPEPEAPRRRASRTAEPEPEAPRRRAARMAEPEPEPEPEPEEEEGFSYDLPLPTRRASSKPQEKPKAAGRRAAPEPPVYDDEPYEPEPEDDEEETYSLEDILSEFGDL